MAIFRPYSVKCACGQAFTVALADGVNAERNPEYREQILAGHFHRTECESCGRRHTVEKGFFYVDTGRGDYFLVKPRQDRHLWRETSGQLEDAVARVPDWLTPAEERRLRVIFGLAELREKLVAADLGLDDRGVEFLKVRILHEHPFLLKRPRLRLVLSGATENELEFMAGYDLADFSFQIRLPRKEAEELANDLEGVRQWSTAAGQPVAGLETPGDYWVNTWRLSPQPRALDELRAYAGRVRRTGELNPNDRALLSLLDRLPRGETLPGWAKLDLQVLFEVARRLDAGPLQDKLFEVRFGRTLDDEWALNAQLDDIETLWRLFRALPPSHIEGNTALREIRVDTGEDPGSWYEPLTHDIYISARTVPDREDFEDVVRHEVGHAVHEDRKGQIDGWLAEAFGWRMWDPDERGVNAWVHAMGGWDQWGVTAQERAEVVRCLDTALGKGSTWVPGPPVVVGPGHVWRREGFGPRLASELTREYWYEGAADWHRFGGKAFFLNYWYRTLVVVDEATLELITRMPSNYAAMSPFEFFAELYALYYDLDDPLRTSIRREDIAWLDANLGEQFVARSRPARPARTGHDDVRRP